MDLGVHQSMVCCARLNLPCSMAEIIHIVCVSAVHHLQSKLYEGKLCP
jgi:hypothetical protein